MTIEIVIVFIYQEFGFSIVEYGISSAPALKQFCLLEISKLCTCQTTQTGY